nr:MFS transporter [Alphaproteobacteria bacterium]
FKSWGWRVPFLVSIILLLISVYIRLKLQESPIFSKLKNKDQLSKKPLRESFTRAGNRYYLLLALIVTAGQGAICYAGQLYALIFLQNSIKLDMLTSYLLVGIAQLIAIPFFPLFGWLSDLVGRKAVLLAGLIVPVFLLMPAFQQLSKSINPALSMAEEKAPVVLIVAAECNAKCQEARKFLAGFGISYQFQTNTSLDAGHVKMQVGQSQLDSFDPNVWKNILQQYQYPMQIDYTQINYVSALLILSALMICVALIYAPIGAFLVDIFPAQIRYSSLSVTYHIGSGWFGGFMPLVATALVSSTGDIHAGIWYPTIVGAVVFILTFIFLSSKKLAEAKSHDAKILEQS